MNITIIGKVSVGKSSFINSFHSMLYKKAYGDTKNWQPIATISLQRETFQPVQFSLNGGSDTVKYEETIKKNKNLRSTAPKNIAIQYLNIKPNSNKILTITDFPGFDDSGDPRDMIGFIANNMGDITIFVVDATRPFVDKSELEYYNKIVENSKKLNESGHFNEVFIVVNKFDFLDDEDLNELYEKIPKNNKFRWCSYSAFTGLNIKEKSKARSVTAPCDIDGFLQYLLNYDLKSKKYNCSKHFTISICEKGAVTEWNNIYVNDLDVKRAYTRNFIKHYRISNLPKWAFVEKTAAKCYKKKFSSSQLKQYKDFILHLLHYVEDFRPYTNFIKEFLIDITVKNEHIVTLQKWAQKENWELLESFHKNTAFAGLEFPYAAGIYFSIDLKLVIRNCYGQPLDKADIIKFASLF